MADVLPWRNAAQPRDVVAAAVRALAEGALVAFPTETAYVAAASALHPGAVERLGEIAGADNGSALSRARAEGSRVFDGAPARGPGGGRRARRCWPGPLALTSGEGVGDGLSGRLAEPVARRV